MPRAGELAPAQSAPSARSGICLILAIVLTLVSVPVGPVAAEGPADGTYDLVLKTTRECEQDDGTVFNVGAKYPLKAKVVQSGSDLSFTILGQPYKGSISSDLNFDITVDNNSWIGHFTLASDGGATIAGEVVGGCSGSTVPFMKLTGKRTSGGAGATVSEIPSPAATRAPTGGHDPEYRSYVLEMFKTLCGNDEVRGELDAAVCAKATKYSSGFVTAMRDRLERTAGVSKDENAAVFLLINVMASAAYLGSLQRPAPCDDLAALPITSTLLPVFVTFFIQGLRQAGAHQLAELQATLDVAQRLLVVTLTLDRDRPQTPCPEGPKT